jgi:choline transport protein
MSHQDGSSTDPEKTERKRSLAESMGDDVVVTMEGQIINASGHKDQLSRQYGLLSICGLALTVDNAWVAIGTSLAVSIYNGGPPGVIWELWIAFFYYSFIGASIAELASSVPTAGGVYHWASITPGPKWGRPIGFFAGSLNYFGWLFDLASIVYIMSELCVQMYFLYHPDYVIEAWHIFVGLLAITIICVSATIFFNTYLPYLQQFGLFIVIVGGIVTIITLAAMPAQHSANSFVWTDFQNETGWVGGIAFLTGVLNGAFTIGTPDAVTHMAEELPNPKRDLPKAIFAQLTLGFLTAFCFAIALFYGVSDLAAVQDSNGSFPLAQAFTQATGSRAATFGLLFIVFLSLTPCLIGTFLTVGRTWWALARDNAVPFSGMFSQVNEKLSCPIPATVFTGVLTVALGAITLGSKTAFTDLAGSFIILSSTSYALAFAPNLFTGRQYMPPGPFHMGKAGYAVNAIAVIFTIFFNILYCFPYALPTTVASMNYNSVIFAGVLFLTTVWWFVYAIRKYEGPKLAAMIEANTIIARSNSKV